MKHCQVCSKKLTPNILNLGLHPLCDDLIPINSNKKNQFYKINISYCNNCFTAFQTHNVNKNKLFPKTYHYRAKLTADVVNGMKELIVELKKQVDTLRNKKVLDIGCNDGSLLNLFKLENCKTIGIEPTDAYKEAKKNGHDVYSSYFNREVVRKIKKKYKTIDIITFTNVFAHIENFRELIKNLKSLISKETIIVIENHYLGSVTNKNQFDTFYHEHPRTYSVNSFLHMQELLGLNLTQVSFPKRYCGNIRVFFQKKKTNLNYKLFIKKEKKIKKQLRQMSSKITKWKKKKIKLIKKIVSIHGPVPAKAFPGRAAIILRLLKADEKMIKCVYEKNNSLKINHFVPGTKIPILSEKNLLKEKSGTPIINLAWHISKEIKMYIFKLGMKNKIIDIIDPKDFK